MQAHLIGLAIASVVFILIVLLYTRECPKPPPVTTTELAPQIAQVAPLVGTAKTWREMSPDEKIDYLVTRYLDYDIKDSTNPKIIEQNKYIASLPQNGDCADDYDKCPAWAVNGECDINPEYMLYNCKKSCKSCALTPQQLENVTAIMNDRNPPDVHIMENHIQDRSTITIICSSIKHKISSVFGLRPHCSSLLVVFARREKQH